MKTLTDARNYSKSRNPHDGRALKLLAFSQADIGHQSQRPQGATRLLFNSQFCYHIHDKVIESIWGIFAIRHYSCQFVSV